MQQIIDGPRDGVVVYCASSSQVDPHFLRTARTMGRLIAESGLRLVTGGGVFGLMGQSIEGCIEAGGEAIGVLPQFMIDREWAHPDLTQVISTPTMHVRKETMARMSRAAVALAGGIGTLDELAEIMTWRQLKLYDGPVIIVNTDGYYDPLIEMFRRMKSEGFMRDHAIPATVVDTPAEAIDIIRSIRL